jgi:hypothetical protein
VEGWNRSKVLEMIKKEESKSNPDSDESLQKSPTQHTQESGSSSMSEDNDEYLEE